MKILTFVLFFFLSSLHINAQTEHSIEENESFMKIANELAKTAANEGNYPFGAVVVNGSIKSWIPVFIRIVGIIGFICGVIIRLKMLFIGIRSRQIENRLTVSCFVSIYKFL